MTSLPSPQSGEHTLGPSLALHDQPTSVPHVVLQPSPPLALPSSHCSSLSSTASPQLPDWGTGAAPASDGDSPAKPPPFVAPAAPEAAAAPSAAPPENDAPQP